MVDMVDCDKRLCTAAINGLDKAISIAKAKLQQSVARYSAAVDIWTHICAEAPEMMRQAEYEVYCLDGPEYLALKKWDSKSDYDLRNYSYICNLKDFIQFGSACQVCQSIKPCLISSNPQSSKPLLNTFLRESMRLIELETLSNLKPQLSHFMTKESLGGNIVDGPYSTTITGPAEESGQ